MKYFFITISIICLPLFSSEAIGQTISNVDFHQEGDALVINYNLAGSIDKATVSLFVSTDGGATFKGPLTKVSGDVGNNITTGSGKAIKWNALSEMPSLSGEIVFDVRAKVASKEEAKVAPEPEKSTPKKTKSPKSANRDFDNAFYLKFGYSIPGWSSYNMEEADWDFFLDDGFDILPYGGMFQLGNIFYFNSISFGDFCFGLDLDYLSLTLNAFNISDDNYTLTLTNYHVSSNIGPSISFSPIDNLYFEAFWKLNWNWATFLVIGDDEDSETYLNTMDYRNSIGINARYRVIGLGIEYGWGEHELISIDDEDLTFGNLNGSSDYTYMPFTNIIFSLYF